MEMHANGRDRFGGLNQFKSSLTYLIRDTEKNLHQGVYGTTEALTGAPSAAIPAYASALAAEAQIEGPRAAWPVSKPAPSSPPLNSIDGALDMPTSPLAAVRVAPSPSPVHRAPLASGLSGTSAMGALHAHLSTQDALAAVRAECRESSEAVHGLQATLGAFKTKMRAAFDANMSTLDKKVRLVRKDVLTHISDTVGELEQRMVAHLAHGIAAGPEQHQEQEFRRNTQEELLFLKSELAKAQFASSERTADAERARRSRDHAFTSLQSKVDEHTAALHDAQAAVYATEKENLLLRAELESLKTKVRRDVSQAHSDGQHKFVDLSKGLAEMKKTLEAVVRREAELESERVDTHAQMMAHVNAAAQTYIDEHLFQHAATVKTLKRTQLLQADEVERLKKEMASTRHRRNEDSAVDESSIVSKALSNLAARIDNLERESHRDRARADERAQECANVKRALHSSEAESRDLHATSMRSLREDLARSEHDALAREQHARTWRDEINAWSRGLEQTILNLKYAVNSSVVLNSSQVGGDASGAGGALSASAKEAASAAAAAAAAAAVEHPADSPLSHALSALETRTAQQLASVEEQLRSLVSGQQHAADTLSLVQEAQQSAPTQAMPDPSILQTQAALAEQMAALEQQADELEETCTQLRDALDHHAADTKAQFSELSDLHHAQRDCVSEATRALALLAPVEERLTARIDQVDAKTRDLTTEVDHLAADLDAQRQRVDKYESQAAREAETVRQVQSELQRQQEALSSQTRSQAPVTIAPTPSAVNAAPAPTVSKPVLPAAISGTSAVTKSAPLLPRTVPASVAATVVPPTTVTAPSSSPATVSHALAPATAPTPTTAPAPAPAPASAPASSSSSTSPPASSSPPPVPILSPTPTSIASPAGHSSLVSRLTHSPAPSAPITPAPAKPTPPKSTTPIVMSAGGWQLSASLFDEPEEEPVVVGFPSPKPKTPTPKTPTQQHARLQAQQQAKPQIATPQTHTSKQGQYVEDESSSDEEEDHASPAVAPPQPAVPSQSATRQDESESESESDGSDDEHDRPVQSAPVASSSLLPPKHASLPRHPGSAVSPLAAAVAAASAATKPTTITSVAAPTSTVALATTSAQRDDDKSSEDEPEEDDGEGDAPPRVEPSASLALPPLHASLSPTGIDHVLDDEDHTNGVPHSVLSAAVKQRYLDAEAAGLVDGEAEIDEDSLYDPEAEEERPGDRPISERAKQIAAAHQRHLAAQRRGYDDEDDDDDLGGGSVGADPEDDFDLDETAAENDLSLNSKFRAQQASAAQLSAQKYHAAHHALQSGAPTWDSEEEEEEEEEPEEEDPSDDEEASHQRPLGPSLLDPAFGSPHRVPLSNPGLSGVSELSPLTKPMSAPGLKSNLGSVRPALSLATGGGGLTTPAFMRPPLGSPKSSSMIAGQSAPRPLPQPLPTRTLPTAASVAAAAAAAAAAAQHTAATDFDDDADASGDLLSSLSHDYRRLGGGGGGGATLSRGGLSSGPSVSEGDEDLSSPRPEDLRSAHTTGMRHAALGSMSRRAPLPAARHTLGDDDDEDSLFDTSADRTASAPHDEEDISELDQMELSASQDAFGTSF